MILYQASDIVPIEWCFRNALRFVCVYIEILTITQRLDFRIFAYTMAISFHGRDLIRADLLNHKYNSVNERNLCKE